MTDGYANEYGTDEASEVTVDFIISIGVALVSFATLIGLVWVIGYLKKKIPRF